MAQQQFNKESLIGFLSDKSKYQFTQPYIQGIEEQDFDLLFLINEAVGQILKDKEDKGKKAQYSTMCKIGAMRLLKDCAMLNNLEFNTLVLVPLLDEIQRIILQSPGKRAQALNETDKTEINTLEKLCVQSLYMWSIWFPKDSQNNLKDSQFKETYDFIRFQGTPVPENFNFYKEEDQTRFNKVPIKASTPNPSKNQTPTGNVKQTNYQKDYQIMGQQMSQLHQSRISLAENIVQQVPIDQKLLINCRNLYEQFIEDVENLFGKENSGASDQEIDAIIQNNEFCQNALQIIGTHQTNQNQNQFQSDMANLLKLILQDQYPEEPKDPPQSLSASVPPEPHQVNPNIPNSDDQNIKKPDQIQQPSSVKVNQPPQKNDGPIGPQKPDSNNSRVEMPSKVEGVSRVEGNPGGAKKTQVAQVPPSSISNNSSINQPNSLTVQNQFMQKIGTTTSVDKIEPQVGPPSSQMQHSAVDHSLISQGRQSPIQREDVQTQKELQRLEEENKTLKINLNQSRADAQENRKKNEEKIHSLTIEQDQLKTQIKQLLQVSQKGGNPMTYELNSLNEKVAGLETEKKGREDLIRVLDKQNQQLEHDQRILQEKIKILLKDVDDIRGQLNNEQFEKEKLKESMLLPMITTTRENFQPKELGTTNLDDVSPSQQESKQLQKTENTLYHSTTSVQRRSQRLSQYSAKIFEPLRKNQFDSEEKQEEIKKIVKMRHQGEIPSNPNTNIFDKLQFKGRIIQFTPELFENLNFLAADSLTFFKKACLRSIKSILFENDHLQVNSVLETQVYEKKKFLVISLYFKNSSRFLIQDIVCDFEGSRQVSMWLKPEKLSPNFQRGVQYRQDVVLDFDLVPFKNVIVHLQYNFDRVRRNLKFPLPATIFKFFEPEPVNQGEYERLWYQFSSHIIRSGQIFIDQKIFFHDVNFQSYFDHSLNLEENENAFISDVIGGQLTCYNTQTVVLYKITFVEATRAVIQIICYENPQFEINAAASEFLLQTLVYLINR